MVEEDANGGCMMAVPAAVLRSLATRGKVATMGWNFRWSH